VSGSTASALNRRLPALLAAVGVLSSVALEVVHVRAYADPSASSFCSAGAKLDCTTVALSRLSIVLGVPLPIWGLCGFIAIGIAALRQSAWLVPLSAAAAVASIGLLAAEIVSIKSVCLLCEVVHVVSLALVVLAWRARRDLVPISLESTKRVLVAPGALFLAAVVLVPPYWAFLSWQANVPFPTGVDPEGHPWVGAENPTVTLHEYTDYGCPHCAVSTNRSRRFLAKYPSKLRLVRHQYARMRCASVHACVYARAADCAGDQGKFWQMDGWLFEHVPGKSKVDLDQAARDVGLDGAALKACMASPPALERAKRQSDEADKARINETPTYFIDGKRYDSSAAFEALGDKL
jgi:uncharacterized membrane protein